MKNIVEYIIKKNTKFIDIFFWYSLKLSGRNKFHLTLSPSTNMSFRLLKCWSK